MAQPCILYIGMVQGNPSQTRKLAGIRRYCAMRGWNAKAVFREDATPGAMPDILNRHRPVGCVIEGVGRHYDLPPYLFSEMPVSYIGYPKDKTRDLPNFHFDPAAIAEAAIRELSAGMPQCYAAVGFPNPLSWSLARVGAFRSAIAAAGAECLSFPTLPGLKPEPGEHFVERLAAWLAKLPEHCAVFAVSDETAVLVVHAARIAMRPIPRSITLVSVDNFEELCENADPTISSIQLDFEREGFLAARALDDIVSRRGAKTLKGNLRASVSPCESGNIAVIGPLLTVRRKSTSGRGRHEPWIMEAVEAIRAEACNGLSAAELIGRYPVSKRLFTMRFREATGHSVLDEIIHVRLEKAFTLLARTDTAIGAVPGLCGFNCDRTLDAIFRKRFGMSMLDWRRKNRY